MWEGELDDLLNVETGLSDKEIGFLDNMNQLRTSGGVPSDAQRNWISLIWKRVKG